MSAAAIGNWIEELGLPPARIEPLAGDLSQRRYLRLHFPDESTRLVAVYPENLRASMPRFVAARRLLAEAGVRVPEIPSADFERGLMLIEDLGEATLYENGELDQAERVGRFREAVDAAERISRLDPEAVDSLGSPPLDSGLLRRELDATFEFLFEPRGLGAGVRWSRELRSALGELCDRLAAAPLVACHRDYMARNLIPVAQGLAVIDFQDLRLGPAGYDLASLLNDSFFPEAALEESLLPAAWRRVGGREQYARAVVQRGFKAAGTFARFAAQGNPRHLALIAPTLDRSIRHLEALPETGAIAAPFREWWTSTLALGAIC